ncbi:ADP-ribosylation factor-like protein 13B isoform X1 [Fopius arisanus]|uniref:ADP-ribosylation factor-like protein 13B isoform X1 n=2 Tax=Fopius arisanus TaxID=64838 RepID=A0A9R1TI29_9HYME|nr:PREDICTED: ADP-ribosylation factor-like protein 13B isoform X1 [Fopius arisanus]
MYCDKVKMGNCLRFLMNKFSQRGSNRNNIVLMMTGLDNAGKTTVLNRLNNEFDPNVMPTMGFRVLSLGHKSYVIKVYDIGGATQIRAIWKRYYHDIHGLIYVVDASDISRLTENKIIFGELITNEHIAGKPILLLANKQDRPGAIDELDVVENLDVEHVANAMKCPTRVELCSATLPADPKVSSTMGIIEGYKWLLDTISKNYSIIDNRVKMSQSPPPVNNHPRPSIISMTPSRASIRSNPFKPISQLVGNSQNNSMNHSNHIEKPTTKLKKFLTKNKTAPMPPTQAMSRSEDFLNHMESETVEPFFVDESNDQVALVTLDPLALMTHQMRRPELQRPFTAPAATNGISTFLQNIPGQVPQ